MTQIYVKVRPGSDEFRIKMKQIPEIMLEEEPENGRANLELVKKLEEILGVKPGIVSGHRSKRKKLEIPLKEDEIRRRMENHG